MNLILMPLPNDRDVLAKTAHLWMPFLDNVSERSGCPVEQHVQEILQSLVQITVIYDTEMEEARGLVGAACMKDGDKRVAELCWLTGHDKNEWSHLLPDLEEFYRKLGCSSIRAKARPGWSKDLKQRGYKLTHVIYEKPLIAKDLH